MLTMILRVHEILIEILFKVILSPSFSLYLSFDSLSSKALMQYGIVKILSFYSSKILSL